MRTLPRNFAQLPLVNETTLSVGFEPGALEQLQEWARGAGASVENVRASAGEKKLFISNDMATPMEVLREWQRTEVVLSNVALIPVRNRLFLEVRGAVDDRVLDPVTIIDGQRRVELRWRQLDGEVPKDDLGWASGRSDLELLRARQFAVDTGKLSADAALDFHDGYVVADPKDLVGLKSLSIDCHWDLQFFCSGAPYAGKDTEIYFYLQRHWESLCWWRESTATCHGGGKNWSVLTSGGADDKDWLPQNSRIPDKKKNGRTPAESEGDDTPQGAGVGDGEDADDDARGWTGCKPICDGAGDSRGAGNSGDSSEDTGSPPRERCVAPAAATTGASSISLTPLKPSHDFSIRTRRVPSFASLPSLPSLPSLRPPVSSLRSYPPGQQPWLNAFDVKDVMFCPYGVFLRLLI
ncbi:hypothetical protein PAPYR_11613 [Paratrimastix pyriformis]|uniref:Uncharacterized protein n=1 Tax=Paratrimastix pyriformis TaxID=342808 RepID=A0ABQ8U5W0_9EUKA|nr:hypothetical protein PAPYR_11613 [Paratrimastix pyriformis]